jgi:hypothetical protein
VEVLRRLRAERIPVLLYGPPGTGKTSLVEAALPDVITVGGHGDTPERVGGLMVTPSYFRVFDVAPFLGRTFAAEEGSPGNDDGIVLSYALWRRRFGADPSIIGRAISIPRRLSGCSLRRATVTAGCKWCAPRPRT